MGLKKSLKKKLFSENLNIFIFSLMRNTSYLLPDRHSLGIHQILIHYLWLQLRV